MKMREALVYAVKYMKRYKLFFINKTYKWKHDINSSMKEGSKPTIQVTNKTNSPLAHCLLSFSPHISPLVSSWFIDGKRKEKKMVKQWGWMGTWGHVVGGPGWWWWFDMASNLLSDPPSLRFFAGERGHPHTACTFPLPPGKTNLPLNTFFPPAQWWWWTWTGWRRMDDSWW